MSIKTKFNRIQLTKIILQLKKDPRSFKIYKSLIFSVLAQVGAIIISFFLVPITLGFLDNERYGIWLTLISIISWVYLLDLGLGNGLRNRLAEALAVNDNVKAKGYISTTYFFIGFFSFILLIIILPISYFIDWNNFLNVSTIGNDELLQCVIILISFFSFHFFIKLIGTIYTALQRPFVNQYLKLGINFLNLIFIILIKNYFDASLIPIAVSIGSSQLLVYVAFSIYSFTGPLKLLRPDLKSIKKQYIRPLFSLGIKLFIIQVSGVIMFTSSNIIISNFSSPEYVVEYNLANKYMSVSNILFSFILIPFWSAFTEANSQKDFSWIDRNIIKLNKLWIIMSIITIVMVLMSSFFYRFWLGDKVEISFYVTLFTGLYFITMNSSSIYNSLLNGIGRVNYNFKLAIVQLIMFYPIILFFQSIMDTIILAILSTMILYMIISTILLRWQYNKIKMARNE